MTNCDHTYNSFLFTPYLYYPDVDFTVPEVTFMSADTDKYDYSLKGTSVVHYHTPGLRHAQYFSYSHWTGGLYTTATLADSFPGGLIVQCWAYRRSTADKEGGGGEGGGVQQLPTATYYNPPYVE